MIWTKQRSVTIIVIFNSSDLVYQTTHKVCNVKSAITYVTRVTGIYEEGKKYKRHSDRIYSLIYTKNQYVTIFVSSFLTPKEFWRHNKESSADPLEEESGQELAFTRYKKTPQPPYLVIFYTKWYLAS